MTEPSAAACWRASTCSLVSSLQSLWKRRSSLPSQQVCTSGHVCLIPQGSLQREPPARLWQNKHMHHDVLCRCTTRRSVHPCLHQKLSWFHVGWHSQCRRAMTFERMLRDHRYDMLVGLKGEQRHSVPSETMAISLPLTHVISHRLHGQQRVSAGVDAEEHASAGSAAESAHNQPDPPQAPRQTPGAPPTRSSGTIVLFQVFNRSICSTSGIHPRKVQWKSSDVSAPSKQRIAT